MSNISYNANFANKAVEIIKHRSPSLYNHIKSLTDGTDETIGLWLWDNKFYLIEELFDDRLKDKDNE